MDNFGDHVVCFTLNGELQKVSSLPGDTSLNTYIRECAGLKGTKFMCREAGCGACVVNLQFTHPTTCQERAVSVNSCLFPVYACHGYKVTTVEGIGSRKEGYNEIQSRLAHFYGTQCGHCSPGWVMAMYSLLEENPNATMDEIENYFGGNLCRCTGYRPILDAFKSFASDKSKDLEQKVTDIEDLLNVCPKSGIRCGGTCKEDKRKRTPYGCVEKGRKEDYEIEFVEVGLSALSLRLQLGRGGSWYRVETVDEIFEIFSMIHGTYQLVGGNTSKGILKYRPTPEVFIDVNGVSFLKSHSINGGNLFLGAGFTLSDIMDLFRAVAQENPATFTYLNQLADHMEKVAHPHVRNVGTIGGNLMIKHDDPHFPSDMFLLLETVGATIAIRGDNEAVNSFTMPEFLELDMYKKVILEIVFPPLDAKTYIVKTYKISPRAQNALADVNAGFRFKVDQGNKFKVLEQPRIVYGGINPQFIHASSTESYLKNKRLLDVNTLQTALGILGKEVHPDHQLPDPSPEYRKELAQALFYRAVLSLSPSSVSAKYRSGGEDITRPLSSGTQEYQSDNTTMPPLYEAIPKLESLIQCSGEAEYVYDIPRVGRDLFASLVFTTQGPAVLESLDASKALGIPGVVAFFSAKDIPGINTFTPKQQLLPDEEPLFVDTDILFAGQTVGLIVAQTQELADYAADLVKISYKDRKTPVLDVRDVVLSNDVSRIFLQFVKPILSPKPRVAKVVKGDFKLDTQYHFPMETLTCVSVPTDDGGLDVFCSTQWVQSVQETVSLLLNLPENKINSTQRRVGGSYGLKLTRGNLVGGACSLAAYLLQRPVRMISKIETTMEAIGKRYPCYINYEAGVDSDGGIQYLISNIYDDTGSSFNDPVLSTLKASFNNVYSDDSWGVSLYLVKTDKSSSTWTRAPGSVEGITTAEHIMEHIAHEVKKDALSVRSQNTVKTDPTDSMIKTLREKSDYDQRLSDVHEFNQENVWKKRGISLVPMKFSLSTTGNFHALVSIYRNDGTVAVTHGGVEMGQGINTKAAQVCASVLGISLEMVSVKPMNNLTSPNDNSTAGSFTSESVCYAVDVCCQDLNARLLPFRLGIPPPTWLEVVQLAYAAQVNLNATYMFSPITDIKSYDIYGTTVLEAEVDILTGEHKVLRVDILEDTGKSLNPFVDIGQVEGAFIMGLGYFTSEQIIYDPDTGRVLTNRSLNYHIPGAKDIPIDFRVYLKKNGDNPLGILRSKAVGEPPLCMSGSIMFAIRQALTSSRLDMGLPDIWFNMDAPYTVENIFLHSGIDVKKFLL